MYYQQIEPTVDIRTPKIYFSAINLDQADEFVLMMEDLTPGVQGDQLAGCNADQAALAITELAGLSGEYAACLEGRSTADYCVLKD